MCPSLSSITEIQKKFTNAFDEKPLVTNLAIDGKSSRKVFFSKGNPLLPPQFDELQIEKENSVLAKIGDKWGVLGVDPDEKLKVTMNDGKYMAFRHRTFGLVIRPRGHCLLISHQETRNSSLTIISK